MLGNDLLVAPVFREDGTVQYYLPAGRWTHFLSGKTMDGGSWQTETHDFFSLPLMARPNSLIPIGANNAVPDYDLANDVTLHLFALSDGCTANAKVPGLDGCDELKVIVTRNGNTLFVNASGAGKPWKLLLRGMESVQGATGSVTFAHALGTLIVPAPGLCCFTVLL